METVLFGLFHNGTMIATKESKIIKERCNLGMKEIGIDILDQKSPNRQHLDIKIEVKLILVINQL